MATLNSFISFLIYSSSLSLVLFSCIPEKTQAFDSKSPKCILYNRTYLNLTSLRDLLVRQENVIVSALAKRSKLPLNRKRYEDVTWSKGILKVPSEQPKYNCTKVLHPAGVCVNKNKELLDAYKSLLLKIAVNRSDDDSQNAAAIATADRTCLQALSLRTGYGKYVAEVKFLNSTKEYTKLINDGNKKGIRDLLTNKTVEDGIVRRVKSKAGVLGQVVSEFYNYTVISLTKDVEVDYLIRRLSKSPQCKP